MKTTIQQAISSILNSEIKILDFKLVDGGSISSAAKVKTENGTYFIKWNDASHHKMFETEELGLCLLADVNREIVPHSYGSGIIDNSSFIVLEWIETGAMATDFWQDFGRKLAIIHSTHSDTYGLDHTNYIGDLPQYNSPNLSWVDFFISNRLQVNIEAAFNKNYLNNTHLKKAYHLYSKLYSILPEEKPSLLHGDLWNSNMICGSDGYARIFDPAVYFGHREMDLAMSHLFGGFDNSFYESYNETYPLLPDYDKRVDVYNLYPLLVHLNLFGVSYLHPIEEILKRYN